MARDELEWDRTKPLAGQAQYRVQRTDCSWSEWRDISVPIEEAHVLSVQINEMVTQAQAQEFFKQISVS